MQRIVVAMLAAGLLTTSLQAAGRALGDPQAGREKAIACAACHGADGVAEDPQFPHLAGQYADYMVRALLDYRDGSRQDPIMNGIAAELSERDMRNVRAYASVYPDEVEAAIREADALDEAGGRDRYPYLFPPRETP